MPNFRRDSSTARSFCHAASPWSAAIRGAVAIPLAILMLATAGCGGCISQQNNQLQGDEDVEARNKKLAAEKIKLEKLEVKPLLPLIGQEPPAREPPAGEASGETTEELPNVGTAARLLVKPGHWTTTIQEMKANYEDFIGQSSTTLVNSRRQPVTLEHTNFSFQSTRPVALAKGRAKRIESELFIPEQSKGTGVQASLKDRNSGNDKPFGQPQLRKMPSYQYFVIVLSKEISRYGFLKVTDAVRMPWEEEFDAASQPHYQIVLADATKNLPLPSNALTWSSVAHLIWDEVDPTRLSPQQQLALLDWLHWGGRLIINGPDSLDSLRSSFLQDFLPAESTGPRLLTANELSEWSDYWSRRDRGKRLPPLKTTKPWSGLTLKPKPGASELAGGANLFYERGVGKGTVVVSAVQLAERDLINWPGYDSFLNAVLLRRPRRTFSEGPYGGARIDWTDHRGLRLDAHFATGLRLFARDARTKANQWQVATTAGNQLQQLDTVTTTKIDRPGGLGAWSDFNPVSNAAREVLTEAAAVRVPGAGFVILCLGTYLMVLVPLNWMVFRALGRVEWAWIAAPVIALLGTLVIVRQAQLDIGFVRSQTEIALLELQETHSRGLLSRFTALYSSLSTTYDVTFDDPTSVATPFPASDSMPKKFNDKVWNVIFEKHNQPRLSGLAVSSASTRMVHSEEMFSLAGPLRLGKSSRGHNQLENRLGYNLRDVIIVRRLFKGGEPAQYEGSWIGDLRDGDASVIGLRTISLTEDQIPHFDERVKATTGGRNPRVNVEALMNIAFQFPESEDPLEQRRDEWRIVGLIDQVLPGTKVAPAASQIVGATVVLAHLHYGDLPQPRPDVNSRSDVLKMKPLDVENAGFGSTR